MNALGSMLTPFFTDQRVTDYQTPVWLDTAAFAVFFREMLAHGVYLAALRNSRPGSSQPRTRGEISIDDRRGAAGDEEGRRQAALGLEVQPGVLQQRSSIQGCEALARGPREPS